MEKINETGVVLNNQEYWDEYWQQGHKTSFGAEIIDNYDGALKHFWQQSVKGLPDKANVVDLCSGNGALPSLFLDARQDLNITATDLAQLDEAKLTKDIQKKHNNATIKFLSRVDCANLPFEISSQHLVSSQFGFEYGDTFETIKEASRVLVKGGQFIAVMHVDDSRFISQNRETNQFLNEVITKGFVEKLTALMNSIYENNPDQKKLRQEFNQITKHLYNLSQLEYGQLQIDSFLNVVQQQVNVEESLKMIRLFDSQLVAYHLRLCDLMSSSQSDNDLEALLEVCRKNSFNCIKSNRVYEFGDVIGHSLILQKI